MFYWTPLEQRKAIVTQPYRTELSDEARAQLPVAVPCYDTDCIFGSHRLITGNVVIDDADDLRVWSLVAKPVSASKVSVTHGGFLRYATGGPDDPVLFFKFHASSERVYGHGAPSLHRNAVVAARTRRWL